MKDCCICKPWVKNLGLLLARITVGVIFISAGWMKMQDISMFSGMLEGAGFPAAGLLAWLVAIVELVGGAMVLLGIMTKLASLLLALVMLGAILMVHVGSGAPLLDPMGTAVGAIALFGASCGLMASGGGEWKAWSCKCKMS
jgi:putative oxidoreductase